MTKELGLPGVRVGYALGDPTVLRRIASHRPRWSCGAATIAVAHAAFDDDARAYLDDVRTRLIGLRCDLEQTLADRGIQTIPSASTYLAARVGDARAFADALAREHGLLLRPCDSFGLPHHVRIAARPREDLDRLLSALDAGRRG
jgi:histidinol-phosphate/aromatic aminotransferase/cobyric acid decarboxylase-like protein